MKSLPPDIVLSNQRGWSVGWRHLKGRVLQLVSRSAVPMFVRPGDVISTDPIVGGVHEPHIADFLSACADHGYDDFLIDVGANIGLTAVPSAGRFKRIYAFEPNPLAFQILSVNAECSGHLEKFELNNFAIGDQDAVLSLMIPKHNWGGAFIEAPENIYSEKTLSTKDNFDTLDRSNYLRRDIPVRGGRAVFTARFAEICAAGGKAGVIKIDVEGFELSVIAKVAEALPPELAAYVILENWEPSVSVGQFTAPFGSRARAYAFRARPITPRGAPRFVKALCFVAGLPFGRSDARYALQTVDDPDDRVMGDLVLHIGPER